MKEEIRIELCRMHQIEGKGERDREAEKDRNTEGQRLKEKEKELRNIHKAVCEIGRGIKTSVRKTKGQGWENPGVLDHKVIQASDLE